MSYLVLARKWRPLTFDDVVGQEHVTATLKKAIAKNRVAHAYIFTGTRGTGKTTTARILSRAMNCDNGPTPDPCGVCASCKSIIGGSSFDVLEIDGASNNKVEDIRELRDNVGYGTMGGKYRVFVIDEVHMLTKAAFNALLKTLEEPPKNVIFIFATTEPNKIPETIHSRCQRYDFRRISTEQILQRVEHICTSEGIRFERAGLAVIARKADGSMRDALSLLDQVHSSCLDFIGEKDVRSVLGLVDQELYASIVRAIAGRNPAPVLEAVESVLYQGFDLGEFLLGLQEHLRTLLFSRIPGILDNKRISLHVDTPELAAQYRDQAGNFSEGALMRMIEAVRRGEQELKWSAFPRFCVEMLLLKLVYMDNTVALEELLAALKNGAAAPAALSLSNPAAIAATGQKKKSELSAPPAAPHQSMASPSAPGLQPPPAAGEEMPVANKEVFAAAAPQPAARPAFNPARDWPAFVEHLMQNRPHLGSLLSFAYIVGSTANALDLRFPANLRFQFSQVVKKENRDEILKHLTNYAGVGIELHITIETEAKEEKRVNPARAVTRSLEDEIQREPIIEQVLEIFDGEVLT